MKIFFEISSSGVTISNEEMAFINTEFAKLNLHTIKQIDRELNIIRENGRQSYLQTNPQNFSRIVHDYSGNTKGFMIRKGQLEERLI